MPVLGHRYKNLRLSGTLARLRSSTCTTTQILVLYPGRMAEDSTRRPFAEKVPDWATSLPVPKSNPPDVTPEWVVELLRTKEAGKDFLIVDVRGTDFVVSVYPYALGAHDIDRAVRCRLPACSQRSIYPQCPSMDHCPPSFCSRSRFLKSYSIAARARQQGVVRALPLGIKRRSTKGASNLAKQSG